MTGLDATAGVAGGAAPDGLVGHWMTSGVGGRYRKQATSHHPAGAWRRSPPACAPSGAKGVYSVRIGNHAVTERFSEVAMARWAGSAAWEECHTRISPSVRVHDLEKKDE